MAFFTEHTGGFHVPIDKLMGCIEVQDELSFYLGSYY